jgi:aminoglycoside 3-N-acetyltransferase
MHIPYDQTVNFLDIHEGDVVQVSSDVFELASQSWQNHETFNADRFIDSLIQKIGPGGTLLFPTFNWGFCHGRKYDIRKSPTCTGALSRHALKRMDFVRTRHPIYSFAVHGRDAALLKNMKNISAFGTDSPFAFLHQKNAKMLLIGLGCQKAFTFVHYVEEQVKVTYRFPKLFTAPYVDERGKEEVRTYSMWVRDLKKKVVTNVSPLGQILEQRQAAVKKNINQTDFTLISLNLAYEIIVEDIDYNNSRNLMRFDEGG